MKSSPNISLSFNQIINIVNKMSDKEKVLLRQYLWDETTDSNIEIPEKQKKEVFNRMKEMEESPEDSISLEQLQSILKL
jgi:hypothetical protein